MNSARERVLIIWEGVVGIFQTIEMQKKKEETFKRSEGVEPSSSYIATHPPPPPTPFLSFSFSVKLFLPAPNFLYFLPFNGGRGNMNP